MRGASPEGLRAALALALLSLAAACGGGAEAPSCAPLDPPPSALPPPGSCAADGDCGPAQVCGASGPGVDDGEAPLACLASGAAEDRGAPCDEPSECHRGLCVVAGTCVAPCRDHRDCGAGARCRSVTLRRSALAETLRGRACVPELVLPTGTDVEGPREARLPDVGLGASPLSLVLSECAAPAPPERLAPPGADDSPLFVAGLGGAANPLEGTLDRSLSVLLPSGDAGPRGPATLTLDGLGPRRVVGLPLGAADGLTVDLYYVGTTLAPAGERGPPEVAEALAQAEVRHGQRIDTLPPHRVGGAAGTRLS
ncbi:MAG: hypothetical protein AAF447_13745, partial [Myxococcota bacterium]